MGVIVAGMIPGGPLGGPLAGSDPLGGTTKEALALRPLSRINFVTVDGEVISSGLLVSLFLALTLDVIEDDTAGLVELLLLLLLRLRVKIAMVRMTRVRGLVDLVRVKKLRVLGKLERV